MPARRILVFGCAALLAAALATGAYARPKSVASPSQVGLAGTIDSLKALEASPENTQALLRDRPGHHGGHHHKRFHMKRAPTLPNGNRTASITPQDVRHAPHIVPGSPGVLGTIDPPVPGNPGTQPGSGAPANPPGLPGGVTATTTPSFSGFVGATTISNITDGASELEPPDQGIAVNNNTVLEIINNTVQIFNSAGATLLGPVATDVFFRLGTPPTDFNFESDPQAFFDPFVGRWFVDELYQDSFTGFSGFALAVSQTSDPTGAWFVYHVRAFGGLLSACKTSTDASTCLPDFPKAGYNGDGFFITADMFGSFGGGGFVNAVIYSLPIARLINGQAFTYFQTVLSSSDFVIQPSIPALNEGLITTNGGTEFMMEARNIVDASENVRVIAFTSTSNLNGSPPTAPVVRFADFNPGVPYTSTIPAVESGPPGPLCMLNGVTSPPTLDAVYQSFTANIIVANGNLWGILPYAARDSKGNLRDVLGIFIVAPNLGGSPPTPSPTNVAAGTISSGLDGFSLLDPTLAINSSTKIGGIGMTFVGPSLFPSTLVAQFTYGLGPFSFGIQTPLGLHTGSAADDGFTFCFGITAAGRWGDYGQASTDPTTGSFWFSNELIPFVQEGSDGQFTNWGTFVTRLN